MLFIEIVLLLLFLCKTSHSFIMTLDDLHADHASWQVHGSHVQIAEHTHKGVMIVAILAVTLLVLALFKLAQHEKKKK